MNEAIKQSIEYYGGKVSLDYSNVRYAPPIDSYIKYLFTTRLKIFLNLLGMSAESDQGLSIFEIGCADGVLFRNILKNFPRRFNHLVGVDITPDMVMAASQANIPGASFYLRGTEPEEGKYDFVIEIGVHTVDFKEEIAYVKSKLKAGGLYLKTVSSRASSHASLKLRDKPYFADLLTYPEYDQIFSEHFEIIDTVVYGLFIPKLWSLPWRLALPLQKLSDFIFRPIVPGLFHEKIYLLKSRG